MSISGELERLKALHAEGTLSDAEYQAAKAKALGSPAPGRRERSSLVWAVRALVVVAVVAAGAVLVMLDDISRSLEVIAGGVGLLGAAAGAVIGVMEDASLGEVAVFAVVGLAIGAVVFAGLAPIVIVVALVLLPIGLLWNWIAELIS